MTDLLNRLISPDIFMIFVSFMNFWWFAKILILLANDEVLKPITNRKSFDDYVSNF